MGISPVLIADMDGDNKLVDWKESGSFTSKLFNCNRCLTPYVAFVITIVCPSDATGTLEIVRTFVINWLAVSAVALIIYEVLLP